MIAVGCHHDDGGGTGDETGSTGTSVDDGGSSVTQSTTASSATTNNTSNTTGNTTSDTDTTGNTTDETDTGQDTTGGQELPSDGCGVDAFQNLQQVDDTTWSGMTSDGRAYQVDLHPAVLGTLDNATPVPLFFGLHGCYENIDNSRNNLFKFIINGGADPNRPFIAVYPKSAGDCWDTAPTSGDHAYLEEIYSQVYADLCFDTDAVFFAGQSSGAYETNGIPMWPIFGDLPGHTAGIALNAGGPPFGAAPPSPDQVDPVEYFGIHSVLDPLVPIDSGRAARDYYVEVDGCSGSTVPLDPLPDGCMVYDPNQNQGQFGCECVVYDDCSSGHQVVWCEHHWDIHYMPDWGPQAILEFFFAVYG